jgi:competence ComEA-like helix-hairpin-helix protein
MNRLLSSIGLGCLAIAFSAPAQNLPDGPGKEAFTKVCAECHGLDLATNQRLTKAAWTTTVDSMAAKGATATKEDFEAIVNYLAKNFGAAEGVAQASAGAEKMPEGPGKQIILRECTACHLPDHFTKFQHTNEEWQAIIVRMGTRVRSATRQELDTVQKYFATNFPKVEDTAKLNVNKATAQEIESKLSLTPQEAEAVIRYRARHGAFREWGEMLAIYGVDGRKIEAVKDRISF